jgi:crotonobetainyl-CoA hydratase
MKFKFLYVALADHVTTITLARPEVMNAINPAMHEELQIAFDAFAADPEQYICVVKGAGDRAFCAGSDLKAVAGSGHVKYPKNGYAGLIERYDLFKPVIAAVNGLCLGGGFEVALACDLIIAADSASFGLPEPRVGAVALGGGIHRLVRQIGLKRAMGYMLSCTRISAAEAHGLGLVNEVVPLAKLGEAVDRWCEQIMLAAPVAIRTTKEAAMRGLSEVSLEAAISNQQNYPGFRAWLTAEDTKEGPRAFAEKRPAVWKGR